MKEEVTYSNLAFGMKYNSKYWMEAHMMKYLLILLLLIAGGCRSEITEDIPSTPPTTPSAIKVSVNENKSIKELKDERDKMKVELEALQSYIHKREQEQVETYSKWIAWITLILGFAALVASILTSSYPVLPTIMRYISYGLFSVSSLAFTVPFIYPYILPVSLVLVFGAIATSIYFHMKDRKVLRTVVGVVEKHKNEIPDYKSKFRSVISPPANSWIEKVRNTI